MSNAPRSAATATGPFPHCTIQPRAVLFQAGILGVDLLRLGAASDPFSTAASNSAAGPLSSHPLHALTAARPTAAATPSKSLPQAQLGPLHAALRADLQRPSAGSARLSSGLTLSSWSKHAATYFGATQLQSQLYWNTFLAMHRSAHATAVPASSGSAAASLILPPSLRLEVDLQEFMLFLLCQRYRRFSQSWVQPPALTSPPGRPVSQRFSDAIPFATGVEAQRAFLLQHLTLLLSWCKDGDRERENNVSSPNAESISPPPSSVHLTANELDRMALLLVGVTEKHTARELASLSALTPFFGSSTKQQSVSLEIAAEWLASVLSRPAPSVLQVGNNNEQSTIPKLQLMPLVEVVSLREQSIVLRRARQQSEVRQPSVTPMRVVESNGARPDQTPGCIEEVMPAGGMLLVNRCAEINLNAPLVWRFVVLSHVQSAVLHLGVITHQVRLEHCTDCVIYFVAAPGSPGTEGIGSNVQMSHCTNVKLFLYSNGVLQLLQGRRRKASGGVSPQSTGSDRTVPVIMTNLDGSDADDAFEGAESEAPNNSSIILAPFNAAYPELEEDLRMVGCTRSKDLSKASPSQPLAASLPRNSWDAFNIVEPLDFSRLAPPSLVSSASGRTSPAPSAAGSIAAGGRKGRTVSQINAHALLPPLFQTFPALVSVTPSPAVSPHVGPVGSSWAGVVSAGIQPHVSSSTGGAAGAGGLASPGAAVGTDVISLLSPGQFFPASVPCSPSPVSSSFSLHSFPLPDAYAEALSRRAAQARRTRALMDSSLLGLSSEAQHQVLKAVQQEFALWLALEYPAGFLANITRADVVAARHAEAHQLQAAQLSHRAKAEAIFAKQQALQQESEFEDSKGSPTGDVLLQQSAWAKSHGNGKAN
jgi:hypothetical protein